jgi:hypothetical protein
MYFQFIKNEVKLSLSMPCGHTGCIKAQLPSLILNLNTRWRGMANFTHCLLHPQGKSPWYPLNRRLGGLQSWSAHIWKGKSSCPYRESNPISSCPWGNEIANELARGGSSLGFLGPEPAIGVSRQDIQNKLNCWLANQQWARWRSLGDTQRQAQELISAPGLGAMTKVMSFNRTHSRAVIGLLTGHNTLRWHLCLLGLQDSPLCRKCGVMEETSPHILCECETLASLRRTYLGSFFLEPKDIQSISLGAIWSFSKFLGLPWLDMGQKGPFK